MKIVYYCQHVLGVGHFYRSLEICRSLAADHQVTMVTGGPPLNHKETALSLFELPGLQMDTNFQNLCPCEKGRTLAEVKDIRTTRLYEFFRDHKPDVFLVELYPFGRKAFRFELDPILEKIKTGTLSDCLCLCSLRDILVEKANQQKHENRVVKTLNQFFDGLLIHADQQIISLEESFHSFSRLAIPYCYTGFVSPKRPLTKKKEIRKKLGIAANATLIVASIGGGNVGHELLDSVCDAYSYLAKNKKIIIQIFTGPYCPKQVKARLTEKAGSRLRLSTFSDHFMDWLAAADISLSMAGYNTTMNLLSTGLPSLVYPFSQNKEQSHRAHKLAEQSNLFILSPEDLEPQRLADLIVKRLGSHKKQVNIDLNGTKGSAEQIKRWYTQKFQQTLLT